MYNSRSSSPSFYYKNITIVRDLDFEATWLNEKEQSEQDANPVTINTLVTRIQNRTVTNLLSEQDSPSEKSSNPSEDFSLSRVQYECPSIEESDNLSVEIPLSEARELEESVSELSAPRFKPDIATDDSDFERELRSLSSELSDLSVRRSNVRKDLCELISDRRRFLAREREILREDHSEEHRSKRAKFDKGEAYRRSLLRNFLAEGDCFNFAYTGLYGRTELIAARVGQFIRKAGDTVDNQEDFTSTPENPVTVNFVFEESNHFKGDCLDRCLLREGLEETVYFV